jgi:hypothetical protein
MKPPYTPIDCFSPDDDVDVAFGTLRNLVTLAKELLFRRGKPGARPAKDLSRALLATYKLGARHAIQAFQRHGGKRWIRP